MSTPEYDMAPPTATVTASPPVAAQPQASGAAPATSSSTQPTQRRRTASQKKGELIGAILPGAILSGLVSLCWLIHQFGLPAVALALLAVAVTTTTALVIKAGRRTAKTAARLGRTGRGGSGGAGPGGRSSNRSGSGTGRRSAGGTGGGSRAGGRGGLGKQGGRGLGPQRNTAPGALSRKPAGLGGGKSPFGLGGSKPPKNSAARTLANTAGGSRPTAGPKSPKGSLFGGSSKKGNLFPHSSGRDAGPFGKHGGSKTNGLGPNSGSGTNSTGPKNGKGKNNRKGTTPASPTAPNGGSPAGTTPGQPGTAPAATPGAPSHRKASALGRRVRQLRRGAVKSAAVVKRAYTASTSPKFRSRVRAAAKMPVKSVRAIRKFYRAATSLKVRNRLRKMARPLKWSYGIGSKVLANGIRWGRRGVMALHSALGMVRSSTLGPNWLRPMARLLYWATTPLARLASASGSWGWLQGWIYKHATSKPTAPSTPAGGKSTTTPTSTTGSHQKVPAPTSAPSATGTPVSSSLSQHAYPLQRAREAIALARIAFASAPADNMKGYETVIQNLGLVNWSMAALMQTVAHVTETEFRVNAAVPERFRWIATQFIHLGGFIDAAHQVYRQVHAEQISNYEQPTWQGRKWDISANWEDAIPAYSSWATTAIHGMPLQFAASAVLDAGHGIALYPGGSMFGYEATIEQLAPLATELYYLMISVADVTEAEFRVNEAITAMHRDAGVYFLGLGAAIQEAHHMYVTLHAEQIWNIKNPTAQGAKWDQARNV
ncbi:hypothetical protein [Streptomyces goshikiensis]|uniref:hypothetical protein n=1 Tax=Streptomyces goshikiensis TaxID=1942 RepID=UPI0036588BC6